MEQKLIKDYNDATDKLKEIHPNFSSFYFEISNKNQELKLFQEYCENFNLIKKLIIEESKYSKNFLLKAFPFEIFTYNNIQNNLIYLEIKFKIYENKIYENKIYNKFEKDLNLNDLRVLEELRLENVKYLNLKASNLKYIYLTNCYIGLYQNCFPKIKIINLFGTELINIGEKIKLPKLEKFNTYNCYQAFKNIFDFKSFQKLKCLVIDKIDDFLDLGDTLLEKVCINNHHCFSSLEEEKNMMEKLVEIKTIKEIKINLSYLFNDDLTSIDDDNKTVKKLIINWENHKNNYYQYLYHDDQDLLLDNFKNKFPYLTDFEIYINDSSLSPNNFRFNLGDNINFKIIKINNI